MENESPIRILLVDDTEDQRRSIRSIIARDDLEIIEASSGAQAIELASASEFATVLLDVRMPGMDGFEVAQALRGRAGPAFLPILFITGAPAPVSYLRRGYSLGAVDFLSHPLVPEVFRAKLDVFIDLHRKTKALDRQAARLEEQVRLRTAELEYQSRLTRTLTENACSALFLLDGEGRITFMNPAAAALTGYTAPEAMGHLLEDLIPRARPHGPGQTLAKVLSDRGRSRYWEDAFLRKDGSLFHASCSVAPLIREDGSAGAVAEIHDISARKAAELELRAQESRLHEARRLEMVGKLAAGIAHDFNNLLTAVNGYSSLCMEMTKPGLLREHLVEIKAAGERAASLTRQLLGFSRQVVLSPREMSLNACVADNLGSLATLAGEHAHLNLDLDPGLPPLRADPELVEQILIHLIRNARDAMTRKGSIWIRTALVTLSGGAGPGSGGTYAVLSVRDNGMGMDPKVKSRIFEPFFTTKEFGRGAGMGLAMVEGIVSQLGCRIEVDSTLGKGSTFRVYFPIGAQSSAHGRGRWGGNETILIAEHNDGVRAFVTRTLEVNGYRVLAAPDAVRATELARAQEGPIHLLLADLLLPGLQAAELARRIRSAHRDCACLFMSTYTDDSSARDSLLAGEARFIQIPFTAALLSETIRDVLDTAHLAAQE